MSRHTPLGRLRQEDYEAVPRGIRMREIDRMLTVTRDDAETMWGENPTGWPAWDCRTCPQHQRNVGWAFECGRCGAKRQR